MLNIFENDTIYGVKYECIESRPFNAAELSHLNTAIPGLVVPGEYNLLCRIYAKGSNVAYYSKSVDTASPVTEGMNFDITKVTVTFWRKVGDPDVKIKIFIPQEAIIQK